MDFELARSNMIEQQIRPWDVLDQRVLDALASLPRENFVPEAHRMLAYSDTRIPLDERGFSLNPNIEARLLQAAVLDADDRTLIIGSGSGYLAACAARLSKHVEAIDDSQQANDRACKNAEQCGVDNIKFITGDLIADLPDKTTYDAIIVNGSMETLPMKLKTRLTVMGRLVVTVGAETDPVMEAQVIRRISENDWLAQSIFDTHLPCVGGPREATGTASFDF